MEDLKESGQAVGAQVLTNLAGFAPPTILSQAARLQARQRFFNLVVTNVPGPQFPLYVLGRRLQVLYPVVPLARRQALGIAVMSYDGHLGFGLLADYDALPELEGDRAGSALGDRLAGSRGRGPGHALEARAARRNGASGAAASPGPTARNAPRKAAGSARNGRASLGQASRRAELTGEARSEVRLALCQMNATVGDIAGNAARIRAGIDGAREAGAELVLFPELALTGYPPEDLLLREHFLARRAAALAELAAEHPRHGRGRRLPRARRGTSTTPPPCSPTAPSRRSTARCTCPTTASSTSGATSSPGARARRSRSAPTASG